MSFCLNTGAGLESDPAKLPPSSTRDLSSADESHCNVGLAQDVPNWLSRFRTLQETDIIILLTPVLIPVNQAPRDTSDPMEHFGRAVARRHARVRQVPYTRRDGITSTHLGFIKRGHVIIFVTALPYGQQLDMETPKLVFAFSDNKPVVIVICCNPDAREALPFPTVIYSAGHSPPALEAIASLVFGESDSFSGGLSVYGGTSQLQSKAWPVEQWNEARDMTGVLGLWSESVSQGFPMDQQTLASLLRRPGYAKHYTVRDPTNTELLGFCATYLSYLDQEGENLVASLALLLVRSTKRRQGIGLSLHNHAIHQLKKTRGVIRFQLGSTFPRIFYGPPLDMPQESLDKGWFQRRGWQLDKDIPGQGKLVVDMILDFADWQTLGSQVARYEYRLCMQEEMSQVLDLVEKTSSVSRAPLGWYDQYLGLMNGPNFKDIVLGVEENQIIAAAITYIPSCGTQVSSNLPWAGQIGNDIGGATCLTVSSTQGREVYVGLLNACIDHLQGQGLKKMFLDGITDGFEDLTKLGFRVWARYRDVWREA